MQPLTLGEPKDGELIYMPYKTLSESVIGQTYEAHVKTQGLLGRGGASKENIANIIMQELPKRVPGLKLNWIEVDDTTIKLQFIGSPFAWAIFLTALPAILELIGVTVTVMAIFLIWSKIPRWMLGLLLLGVSLVYFGPAVGKTIISLLPRE